MNGSQPFESTKEQTTKTMPPSHKPITVAAMTTNRITSLQELLHYWGRLQYTVTLHKTMRSCVSLSAHVHCMVCLSYIVSEHFSQELSYSLDKNATLSVTIIS